MKSKNEEHQTLPPQVQSGQPGVETKMRPKPQSEARQYRAAGKLLGKVALISGGDSGIGKSVAIHFAKEGADVAIAYLCEHDDAAKEIHKLLRTLREALSQIAATGVMAAAR